MEFRQRGLRDERRRRVLRDEGRENATTADDGPSGEPGRRDGPEKSYSEAALLGRQPAITCLVPQRFWTLSVAGLCGLVLIASVAALYVQVLPTVPPRLRGALAALDVAGRGSVAQWLAAMILAAAAAYSAVVFHIRRHKLDDYRGRYRVWIAAIAGLILASLDAATDLHQVVTMALATAVGSPAAENSRDWGLIAVGTGFAVLGGRILVEMRHCRLATGFAILATAAYGSVAAVHSISAPPSQLSLASLLQVCGLLLGHLGVLLAVLSYSRYVYLDAQGTLKRKPKTTDSRRGNAKKVKKKQQPSNDGPSRQEDGGDKKTERQPAKSAGAARSKVRVDGAHRSPAAARGSELAERTTEEAVLSQAGDSEGPERRLSKAEKRRQRKLMRQQKRG